MTIVSLHLAFRFVRLTLSCVVLSSLVLANDASADAQSRHARVSRDLEMRLQAGDTDATSVIIAGSPARIARIAARHGLRIEKQLATGAVLEVPAGTLAAVANDSEVDQISSNYLVEADMLVSNQTIGADLVQQGAVAPGIGPLTGAGVGVVVIDSGVANVPELRGRIIASLDLTDKRGQGLDQNGHGTYVAGVIAAAGANRFDETRGVAPGANIISVKVLDAEGQGLAANVIEALDWVRNNHARYNIRVVNLSLGGAPTQGWRDDPICQAVERLWHEGVLVAAAAGNWGKSADGRKVYQSIKTPGICPHAITVGALNTKGTPYRSDDEVASYSSLGPTAFDHLLKPDLVAPGNKVLGLAAPGSRLVKEHPELLVGSGPNTRLLLSGTSVATPYVAAAVAVLNEAGVRGTERIRRLLQQTSIPVAGGLVATGAGALSLDLALAATLPGSDLENTLHADGTKPSTIAFCAQIACGSQTRGDGI